MLLAHLDRVFVRDVQMRIWCIQFTGVGMNGVKPLTTTAASISLSLRDRAPELRFDRAFEDFPVSARAQAPLHEAERKTAQQPIGHQSVAGRQSRDVNMAIDAHGRSDNRNRPAEKGVRESSTADFAEDYGAKMTNIA